MNTATGRMSCASRISLSRESGFDISCAPLVERKAYSLAWASDIAAIVLPVPGGPANTSPTRMLPPIFSSWYTFFILKARSRRASRERGGMMISSTGFTFSGSLPLRPCSWRMAQGFGPASGCREVGREGSSL
jgi:hypothetical protein